MSDRPHTPVQSSGTPTVTPNAAGYALSRHLRARYELVVSRAIGALKDHGFGILFHVDMHKTMEAQAGKPFMHYTILGVCLPPLTHRILSADPDLGVLLPYHVAIHDDGKEGTVISIPDPYILMDVTHRMDLQPVAEAVRSRLLAVVAVV